ncbi:alpha-L-rhamnosidase [Labilibacter marinus]|uniref:alpha-L-rhamnosidase n=1 Tax=Labilibacter marinus TaxID=1477105 RepID=UPI0008297DD3|nr:alpha-L-rhamnosidase [Labilibacter marinus]
MKLAFKLFSILLFTTIVTAVSAKTKVGEMVCEYHVNPIGIDVEKPRLSWKLFSDKQNVMQTAYEIKLASSSANLTKKDQLIWTSGEVKSDQSVNIEYAGPALKSSQRVYWQVRVWDNKGKASDWSAPSYWEMGILSPSEWSASWITKAELKSDKSLPSQYYRSEFSTTKEVKSARVYVTSLGLYQLFINGNKVGDQLFTPGFTSYKKRLQYQVYDVTDMLQKDNAIGAMLGDGWYRGYLGWDGERAYYGDQLALLAQLKISYADGSSELIVTDKNWRTSYGAIIESDIYNGEKYDATKEMDGWAKKGFDASNWEKVEILDHSKDILVASNGLPVRAIEELKPIEIITTPKGETVLDLGQNMVGWTRLKVKGKKGDQVTLQFAEVLDKEGNFFTTNLRSAEATDIYTLKGGAEEVYEPHFTFHGFRYVKLVNYPGEVTKDAITGIVIHSDMKQTGNFSCSDSLINQLQSNILWGQRDNFLDIPTDCPQRDERVGWTGDTQAFSMTASYNFGVAPFYDKWLKDLALDQQPNGQVPNIIPDMWNNKLGGATGWADASVIVPWTVYKAYGDVRILEQQYKSMQAWIGYMDKKSKGDGLWNEKHFHWGDWLAFHSDKPAYSGAYTETDLIATAYFCHSTTIMSQVAEILGKSEDAKKYTDLAKKIKAAFAQEYITPNGRLVSHTQTAYALAITFDLIPEELKEKSAHYFAEDVKKFKHLTTGFLGTPILNSSLSAIGRDDLAFMLLNRKEYPGWLYPVTMGATTIWERWDTQKPDGTIIDGMNSFNHYAYGAIGEWLYSHVAGISIDVKNPGYKHILFHPHPGGGLTNAKYELNTVYGEVKSAWKINDEQFVYDVTIPANSTGTVTLPNAKGKIITLNGKKLCAKIKQSTSGNSVVLELGSGTYAFAY